MEKAKKLFEVIEMIIYWLLPLLLFVLFCAVDTFIFGKKVEAFNVCFLMNLACSVAILVAVVILRVKEILNDNHKPEN